MMLFEKTLPTPSLAFQHWKFIEEEKKIIEKHQKFIFANFPSYFFFRF